MDHTPRMADGEHSDPSTGDGCGATPTSRVKVAVRIRPLNPFDRDSPHCMVRLDKDTIQCDNKAGKQRIFNFDHVFFESSQEEVYNKIGSSVLVDAFQGYNTTLFAYGQTGSGKTYTIQGVDDMDSAVGLGILPRLCTDLFHLAEDKQGEDSSLVVKVQMSYLEVYNEKIRDLLQPDLKGTPRDYQEGRLVLNDLKLKEDAKRQTTVVDLSWHTVVSYARVHKLLHQGNQYRQRDATSMNELSSRSHSVFTLILTQQYEVGSRNRDKVSRITIVDLAGSERTAKTHIDDDFRELRIMSSSSQKKMKEMEHINQSLVTLGRCLNICSQGGNKHIPVRDSVLTRIISDVFGGNSRPTLVANVSPSLFNFAESVNTLDYAAGAKKIIVRAHVNNVAKDMDVKELKEQVKALEKMLSQEREEVDKSRKAQECLVQEKELLAMQLSDKDEEIQILLQKLEEKEAECKLMRQGAAKSPSVPVINLDVLQKKSTTTTPEKMTPQKSVREGSTEESQSASQAPFSTRMGSGRMTPRVGTTGELSSKELVAVLQGHTSPVYCCVFSRNGEKVVSGSRDHTVRVWDAKRGVEVLCMFQNTSVVLSVDINAQGTRILTSTDDKCARLWEATTGELLHTIKAHTDKVYGCTFSENGEYFVTSSCDRTIKVWTTENGIKICTLRGHTSAVFAATFSHKGRFIASVSDDRTLRLWDWRESKCLKIFEGHGATIWGVTISPDDSIVGTASMDGTIKLWNIHLGACIRTLRGHTAPVHDCIFLAEGTHIVSTGRDRTIRIWDVETGVNTKTMMAHSHTVYHIAVSGNIIASCSSDETLKLWDITQ